MARLFLALIVGNVANAAEPVDASPSTESRAPATENREPKPEDRGPERAPYVGETIDGVTLWRPAVVVDGQLLVVELSPPAGCTKPKISWEGRLYSTHAVGDRFHALAAVKLGATLGDRPLKVRCGARDTLFTIPVTAGTFPESKLSVDPKFSTRPPARVAAESAKIKEAWTKGRFTRTWSEGWLRPATGITTSPFGVRRTFNDVVDSRHRGTDFDGKVGDPIIAPNDGIVVLVADDFYYTGNSVFLDHGAGLFTMYFHMSRVDVKEGERVKRGQTLGAIGSTGRVTGPHLHFGVKLGNTYVNPMDLLAYQPVALGAQVQVTTR